MSLKNSKISSVEKRFLFALILIIAGVQLASVVVQLIQHKSSFEENLKTHSQLSMSLLSKMIETPLGEFNIPEVQQIVDQTLRENSIEFVSIYDSAGNSIVSGGKKESPNLIQVRQDVRSSSRGGEKIGTIEIGVSKDGLSESLLSHFALSVLSAIVLGVSITFMMRLLFRKFVSRPLRRLTLFAQESANTERLLISDRDDEFDDLSKILLKMAGEIKDHTKNLEDQVQQRTSDLESSNTSLKETISQLKRTQDQLVENSKLASLGRMAAGIAHEINNPLSVLKVNSAKLSAPDRDNIEELESFKKRVSTISRMIERIVVVINGMRSFSRQDVENQPFVRSKLTELVSESVELASIRFKSSNVKLEVGNIDDLVVECRSIQISQVIINLLNNAYDAVSLKENSWVRISASKTGDYLEVEVMDSGAGIPEPVARKLMEPFFTTKEVGSGTGLGLSISLGIAKAHHGSLVLDSACKNTRFVLRLPLVQPSEGLTRVS